MGGYSVLALAVVAAAWLLRPQPRKTVAAPSVPTVRAARGVIQNTRRLSGSISAGRFINVGAPVLQAPDTGRGLTLIFLAESGTRVKEGELIAEIDAQDIKDHLVDVEASLVAGRSWISRAARPSSWRRWKGSTSACASPRPPWNGPDRMRAPSRSATRSRRRFCDSPRRNIRKPTRKPPNRCRLPRSASWPTSSSTN